MSDTLDSSTIKTTHFKGSGDGAGDLRELKDRRRNSGTFFFPPKKQQSEKEEGDWLGEKVGREGVISRLIRTNTKRMKCVGVQK